jgi:hypothetical protein
MIPIFPHCPDPRRKFGEYLFRGAGLLAVSMVAYAMTGCGKRQLATDSVLAKSVKPVSVVGVSVEGESETANAGLVTEHGQAEGTPTGDNLIPVEGGDLTETLNSILTDYVDANDRVPRDLSEMVRLKLISRIPEAPPGKRYAINADRREIVLVDQK